MNLVIPFPDISPEIFSFEIGGFAFALRWYALAYIAGILVGWRIAVAAVRRPAIWGPEGPRLTEKDVEEILTWVILGIVIGGRLGFVLFYQPAYYLAHPLEIPMIWQGGMSFHGGFLGVAIGGWFYCWRHKIPLSAASDLASVATPPGLLFGRLANFINAELWGKPSDVPWAVIFPGELAQACRNGVDFCARHPSQLYEAGLEGLLLGGALIWLVFARKALKQPLLTTGVFIAGYGVSRFVVEIFRQADAHYITLDNPSGFVIQALGTGVTMGQLLSVPTILVGLALVRASGPRG